MSPKILDPKRPIRVIGGKVMPNELRPEYRCYYFGPFPPPYWWRLRGINTLIQRLTAKRVYKVSR